MHALLLAFALAAPPDKPPATLDEKIASALKNHPDVKAAEAKRVLAEAELEQARLLITQKVTAGATKVELAKLKVMLAEEDVKIYERMAKLGSVGELEKVQYAKAIPALAAAKAELAAAEVELQQLVGKGVAADPKVTGTSEGSGPAKLPAGPAIDKLEKVISKTVHLNLKEADRGTALKEVLKAAGIDPGSVRGAKLFEALGKFSTKTELVGEQTLAGWVQLIFDEYNQQNGETLNLYVREYGLLLVPISQAPKDAITLTEFAQTMRARKQ
jgi:hypothetical protein